MRSIEDVNIANIEKKSVEENQKILEKLHRQFYHPSEKSFENLMMNAGEYDMEVESMIENISNNGEFCKRYKKIKVRLVVCLPVEKKFNDVVAMDLKQFQNVYFHFIHFIDFFTRCSKTQVIPRKTLQVVVEAFITEWIAMGLGAPNKVLVDNGGESDNPVYIEAMEQYNIEAITTGANSPWSNGICGRNYSVVDLTDGSESVGGTTKP